MRSVQKQLKVKIRDNKDVYRRKLENKLQLNNIRDVWSGMKKNIGFKQKENQADGNLYGANELNSFFSRFSSEKLSILLSCPQPNRPPTLN